MVQEDQIPMCSNSSSGGASRSSSKRLKQKKVPQRGLGVAQLEKIRIEEQQKKDVSNTTNFSSPSTTLSPTHSSSVPSASFSNYPQNNQSKSSIPFRASSPPSGLPSPNHILRTSSMTNFENLQLPQMHTGNVGGFDIGWSLIPTHGDVNVSLPRLWQPYELNLDRKGDTSRLDNHGLSFPSSFSLPYESCPIGPALPDVVPRVQQYQQPSSLVNVSSMSSSSSSVLTFSMDPPSSKSYYSNYSPWWPDEEKMMVGMKRPCPFPFDSRSIPTFHGKFTPGATHLLSRSDLSSSCGNGGTTFDFEPAIPIFREIPLCSSEMPEPTNSKKSSRSQNSSYNGEFLTLAPPAIASSFPNSRLKQSSTFMASHKREFCNFESLPYQASIQDLAIDSGKVGQSQQPKYFSLFPTTKVQVASITSPTGHRSCNREIGESIDLNLRL